MCAGLAKYTAIKHQGLGKAKRICKADEFSSALSFRPCYKTTSFTFYWVKHFSNPAVNRFTSLRLGMIVGKRQARLAVQRNTIKRLIRETFRTHNLAQASTGMQTNGLVVRLAKPIQRIDAHLKHVWRTEIDGAFHFLQKTLAQNTASPTIPKISE